MNISAITSYKNNYKSSFQKLIVDNPKKFDEDSMQELLTSKEVLKLHENEIINIKKEKDFVYFYKKGMKAEEGYKIEAFCNFVLMDNLKDLNGKEVLRQLNKTLALKKLEKEEQEIYQDKVYDKLEEINKHSIRLSLKNANLLDMKDLYHFVSSDEVKKVYDEESIVVEFGKKDFSEHLGDYYYTKISMKSNPNVYITPRHKLDFSDFIGDDIINCLDYAQQNSD